MTTSERKTETTVDPADIATLAKFEGLLQDCLAAWPAAENAFDRLDDAGYGGTDAVCTWGEAHENLCDFAEELEDLRLANGDQGAADYFFFVKRLMGNDLARGVVELINCHDDTTRIEPMLRYAATVA